MKNERFKQLKYNKARLAIMGQIAESGLKVGDRLPSVRSSPLLCPTVQLRSLMHSTT